MSKSRPRTNKAKEKKKKLREKKKRMAKVHSALENSAKAIARRSGEGIIELCLVTTPDTPRTEQHVILQRRGIDGHSIAAFMVDSMCLGIRQCVLKTGVTLGECERTLEVFEESMTFQDCEPAYARKLVENSAAYAHKLGLAPDRDFKQARMIFGDIDASECTEEIELGRKGVPHFDPGPEADIDRIIDQLERAVGPEGFTTSLDEPNGYVPDEDDPDPARQAWRRVRFTEHETLNMLLYIADELFGEEYIQDYAYEQLDPGGLMRERLPNADNMFLPWLAFNFLVDDEKDDELDDDEEERSRARPIASIALEADEGLSPESKHFIRAVLESPFSFWTFKGSPAPDVVELHDILLDRTVRIFDRALSENQIRGAILFGRVVEHEGIALLFGTCPLAIPAHFGPRLVDFRTTLLENSAATREFLLRNESILLDELTTIVERQLNPPPPSLDNMSGELLAPREMQFELTCSFDEALAALKPLASDWTDADFEQELESDPTTIEFPWLLTEGDLPSGLDNIVLGHLTLTAGSLSVSVNSEQRADRFQVLIDELLPGQTQLTDLQCTSADDFRRELARPRPRPLHEAQGFDSRELAEDPEMQCIVEQITSRHWATWPDVPLPALGDITPREAAKTETGRQKLEFLLASFAQDKGHQSPPVDQLRSELGL